MATAPALLSIDEYLRTSYKPDVHFVDGELEERNVGEYSHSKVQQLITALFTSKEIDWQIDAVLEQRVRVNATRVRVPDVTVLRVSDPLQEVVTTPPLLCIEVLSPEDRLSRAELVLADYRAMGVPHIWLIDPRPPCRIHLRAQEHGDGFRHTACRSEHADPAGPHVAVHAI